jgi:WD40 repeat protein
MATQSSLTRKPRQWLSWKTIGTAYLLLNIVIALFDSSFGNPLFRFYALITKIEIYTPVPIFGGEREITTSTFSNNGSLFAASGYNGKIYIWDSITQKKLREVYLPDFDKSKPNQFDFIYTMFFSPDNQDIFAFSSGWKPTIIEAQTGKIVAHTLPRATYGFDSSGFLVTSPVKGSLFFQRWPSLETIKTEQIDSYANLSGNGNYLVLSDANNNNWQIKQLPSIAELETKFLNRSGIVVREVEVSPDGNYVAFNYNETGFDDSSNRTAIWDTRTQHIVFGPTKTHRGYWGGSVAPIYLTWSFDSSTLAISSSHDAAFFTPSIRLVKFSQNGIRVESLWTPGSDMSQAQFSVDGKRLIIAADHNVVIYPLN